MITKEFNNLEEIQKYYIEKINTYVFKEDGEDIELVKFNFDLDIDSNISACDIKALNIHANNINAGCINALDINVLDIDALDINALDIKGWNINAWCIDARDISVLHINADDIYAHDISYWAVCFAIQNITCHSIKGRRENAKHFVLDGTLEVKNDERI